MIAFQFPGQGSQVVGMGAALVDTFPEARATFEEADDALGEALTALCRDGPEESLTATENAQPALLTHGVAASRVLEARGVAPDLAAGHSLGEFSAHVVAGSIGFADAVRLVRLRGQAMARAGREHPGTMAAILGLAPDEVEALCDSARDEGEILGPANFNAPGQIVISGSVSAVRRAVGMAKGRGARRALELTVSGAFHSPLMDPAVRDLARALDETEVDTPRIPVFANVDGDPVTEPAAIRARLLEQLTAPVRWVRCVETMRELGARTFYEPGPGTVLTGLLRRIDRELEGIPVAGPDAVEAVVAA